MPGPSSYAELTLRATTQLERAMARRAQLSPLRRSALDGMAHALRPTSMEPAIPARQLLFLDLGAPEPLAAVAVGNPDTATHVTFQVSGSGIQASTALWGSTREAGTLYLAQRGLGIQNPCVISWLGYRAPGLPAALSNRAARVGAERLAGDLRRFDALRPDRIHLAIEAHSYGATVAAFALALLRGSLTVDALATTGSAGSPRMLTWPGRQFDAVAPGDLLSGAARLFSCRRLPGRRFNIGARPELGLLAVSGHNTSQYLDRSRNPRHGYRDGDTLSLHNLARITCGLEPLP